MNKENNFLIRLNARGEKFVVSKRFLKIFGEHGIVDFKKYVFFGLTRSKLFSLSFYLKFFYKKKFLKNYNKLISLSYGNKNLFKTIFYLRQGVVKKLTITGIGFRVYTKKDFLILKSNLSHLIFIKLPENVSVKVLKNRVVFIRGYEIEKLRSLESFVYSCFVPDPFKGKGIHKDFSVIRLKKYNKN